MVSAARILLDRWGRHLCLHHRALAKPALSAGRQPTRKGPRQASVGAPSFVDLEPMVGLEPTTCCLRIGWRYVRGYLDTSVVNLNGE